MQYIRAILRGLVRLLIVPAKLLWRSVHLAFGLILFAALITLLLGTYFSTDRDVAYSDVDPTSALCGFDLARESDIHGRIAAMLKPRPAEPSWTLLARYRNDEEQLIQQERTTDWLSKYDAHCKTIPSLEQTVSRCSITCLLSNLENPGLPTL